jgi:coenzyme F420-reducing hydrogenase beta subunit
MRATDDAVFAAPKPFADIGCGKVGIPKRAQAIIICRQEWTASRADGFTLGRHQAANAMLATIRNTHKPSAVKNA